MTYIKPPASHECTWRSGPPPELGWWPASTRKDPDYLRYWNGRRWSWGDPSIRSANHTCGDRAAPDGIPVQWTDRWWLK